MNKFLQLLDRSAAFDLLGIEQVPPVHFRIVFDDEFLQRDVVFRQPGKQIKEQSVERPPSVTKRAQKRNIYLIILLNLSKTGASNLTINTKGLIANSCRSS